jgi:hypothetical protein
MSSSSSSSDSSSDESIWSDDSTPRRPFFSHLPEEIVEYIVKLVGEQDESWLSEKDDFFRGQTGEQDGRYGGLFASAGHGVSCLSRVDKLFRSLCMPHLVKVCFPVFLLRP